LISQAHRKSTVQPGLVSPPPLPVFSSRVGDTNNKYSLLQRSQNKAHFCPDGTVTCVEMSELFI